MKIFKVVYYDPETDKYIHQSVKASCFRMYNGTGIISFTEDNEFGTVITVVLAFNINNLISIEQVS